jgi:hypothetical protein
MSLIKDLAEKRASVQTKIDALVALAESEKREFTDVESTEFNAAIEEAKTLDARIEDLDSAEEARKSADSVAKRFATPVGGATVTSEPSTYRAGGKDSYFRDLAMATVRNDRDSIDRLVRNSKEARALNTTDGGAGDFVPPIYLVDQYIKLARAGRVIADSVTKSALPSGTDSINLPKIATGTAVAVQATQGSAVNNVDATTSTVSAPVITLAGGQTVSLQLLEQSPINMDEVILQDLAADYAAKLDAQVIFGSGSSGQMKGILNATGINAVTYTATSPTVAGLYSKVADAVQQIHSKRFLPATHIFMTPRRWAFLLAASDSTGRPLVVPNSNGPFNAVASMGDIAAESYAGTMAGIPVFLDANIGVAYGAGTNEDKIIVARASDAVLFEGTPKAEVLPQTYGQNLQVLVRMYNYAAFTAERYGQSFSVIGGTGLVAPTF